jgi:hypothetical protein
MQVAEEMGVFQGKLVLKYFFPEFGKVLYLICKDMLIVRMGYSLKRHYIAK